MVFRSVVQYNTSTDVNRTSYFLFITKFSQQTGTVKQSIASSLVLANQLDYATAEVSVV